MNQEVITVLRSLNLDRSIQEFKERCQSLPPDEINEIVNGLARLNDLRRDLIVMQNVKLAGGKAVPAYFGAEVETKGRTDLDIALDTAPPCRLIRG